MSQETLQNQRFSPELAEEAISLRQAEEEALLNVGAVRSESRRAVKDAIFPGANLPGSRTSSQYNASISGVFVTAPILRVNGVAQVVRAKVGLGRSRKSSKEHYEAHQGAYQEWALQEEAQMQAEKDDVGLIAWKIHYKNKHK